MLAIGTGLRAFDVLTLLRERCSFDDEPRVHRTAGK